MGINVGQVLSFVGNIGASYILNRITAPNLRPDVDLEVKNGDYGVPIPIAFGGEVRLAPRIIAAGQIKETATKANSQAMDAIAGTATGASIGFTVGGPVGAAIGGVIGGIAGLLGFGGGGQKVYTYSVTFAMLLADRSNDDPIQGVNKMWANGRVIFDTSEQGFTSQQLSGGQLVRRVYGSNRYFKSLTIYGGGNVQVADPILEGVVGTSPAYRGSAYVVIEDLQLKDFGNTLPTDIQALVQAKQGETLASIVNSIARAAGVDVSRNMSSSALAIQPVRGYAIDKEVSCWDAISPLMAPFRVDAADVSGQIQFYRRLQGVRSTIPFGELGAYEYGNEAPERLLFSRSPNFDLPQETSLTFVDPGRDYLPNTASSFRTEGRAQSNIAINLALTLTADEGATTAATIHWDAWLGRTAVSTTLDDGWSSLTPGRVFGIPFADEVLPYRMTRKIRGANGINECDFVSADNVAFEGTITGGTGAPIPQESTLIAPTRFVIMNMPMLSDADDDFGYYIAISGQNLSWPRGEIQVSEDEEAWGVAVNTENTTVIGEVQGTLPAGPTTGWDNTLDNETVLTIQTLHDAMELESVTDAQLDANLNFAYVGRNGNGQGEYLQFKTATRVGPRLWELTGLRRGRRGTDWAMPAHVSGEFFALLGNAGVVRIVYEDDSPWGVEVFHRGVTFNQDPDTADVVSFTNNGESKRPFSPIFPEGEFSGGDLTITWTPRFRFYQAGLGSDEPESYEVDIYRGATFRRTITSSTPSVIYTAAQQTTDGFLAGEEVNVEIFQLNTLRGRSRARLASFLNPDFTIDLEDGAPILLEDDITPLRSEA